jgi:hypothetical protein
MLRLGNKNLDGVGKVNRRGRLACDFRLRRAAGSASLSAEMPHGAEDSRRIRGG